MPQPPMDIPGQEWRVTHISSDHLVSRVAGLVWSCSRQVLLPKYLNADGYYTVNICARSHRVARLVATAFIPRAEGDGESVDHIHRHRGLDDATGLRWLTMSHQQRNKVQDGVRLIKSGRWQARMMWEDGVRRSLGTYGSRQEAVDVYRMHAAIEFAHLVPDSYLTTQ